MENIIENIEANALRIIIGLFLVELAAQAFLGISVVGSLKALARKLGICLRSNEDGDDEREL